MAEKIEEIVHQALKHIKSRYLLVKVASLRERCLARGDRPLVLKDSNTHKNSIVALKECAEGLWDVRYRE
ncbi:MAG: DNA-directed RNA polymerase subunit omega [Deltaproteobacteria bacterium]|nr:DNA-directed RNA polymerase subunit omega [Deltaproteobacteria bacterium]